ncbi:hypothetical protein HDU91_002573, partial [Kappamyces sp. JEL0680]
MLATAQPKTEGFPLNAETKTQDFDLFLKWKSWGDLDVKGVLRTTHADDFDRKGSNNQTDASNLLFKTNPLGCFVRLEENAICSVYRSCSHTEAVRAETLSGAVRCLDGSAAVNASVCYDMYSLDSQSISLCVDWPIPASSLDRVCLLSKPCAPTGIKIDIVYQPLPLDDMLQDNLLATRLQAAPMQFNADFDPNTAFSVDLAQKIYAVGLLIRGGQQYFFESTAAPNLAPIPSIDRLLDDWLQNRNVTVDWMDHFVWNVLLATDPVGFVRPSFSQILQTVLMRIKKGSLIPIFRRDNTSLFATSVRSFLIESSLLQKDTTTLDSLQETFSYWLEEPDQLVADM